MFDKFNYWKKKRKKFKFLWLALLFKHFFFTILPKMYEQEKKRQRIYDLLNAENKLKNFQNNWSFLMAYIKTQTINLLIKLYRAFLKTKQMQLLTQTLVRLRL